MASQTSLVERKYLNPSMYARLSGIPTAGVLHFIRTGQLRAFNSSLGTQRPRWRITPEAIREFEASLSNVQPPTAKRRRKSSSAAVKEYF